MVAKSLRFMWAYFKVNMQSVMEYKLNFVVQSIGMFVNDIFWVVFWYFFFSKFQYINSWNFQDMLLLYAVLTTAFGAIAILFGNHNELAEIISSGKLDFYLTLPKEELTHILVSDTQFDGWGDFLFGIAITVFFVPISKYPLLLVFIILSAIIMLAFTVIVGSLAFFMGSARSIARAGWWSLIALSSYPISLFSGIAKIILLTLIPAGFVSGIPVELLKSFNSTWFLYTVGFTILISVIAVTIFKIGVKRYESGNLINVRV